MNDRVVGRAPNAVSEPGEPEAAQVAKASCQSYTYWTRAPRRAKPELMEASATSTASFQPPVPFRRIQSARIWARIQNGMMTSRVADCWSRSRYLMSTMAISTALMTWLTTDRSVAQGAPDRVTAVEPDTTSAICSRLTW